MSIKSSVLLNVLIGLVIVFAIGAIVLLTVSIMSFSEKNVVVEKVSIVEPSEPRTVQVKVNTQLPLRLEDSTHYVALSATVDNAIHLKTVRDTGEVHCSDKFGTIKDIKSYQAYKNQAWDGELTEIIYPDINNPESLITMDLIIVRCTGIGIWNNNFVTGWNKRSHNPAEHGMTIVEQGLHPINRHIYPNRR